MRTYKEPFELSIFAQSQSTWGNAFEGRTIQLNNGFQLGITDNLYKALRRLRRPLASRTLWVDALCINQNDIDERGWQVSIMGQIYKSALNVLVWLGEYKNASRLDPWRMRLPHKSNDYERTGRLNDRGSKFAAKFFLKIFTFRTWNKWILERNAKLPKV